MALVVPAAMLPMASIDLSREEDDLGYSSGKMSKALNTKLVV